jgi:GAF domain-containing protein
MKNVTSAGPMRQPSWSEFQTSLLDALDVAIAVDGAAKGNIQLFNHSLGVLQIIADRGFDTSFLQFFQTVRTDEGSACSRAFRTKRRVVIPDVTLDPLFQPYLSIASANGFQAVQSTPVVDADGSAIGVFSTHFAEPHDVSPEAAAALDDCACSVARLIRAFTRGDGRQ